MPSKSSLFTALVLSLLYGSAVLGVPVDDATKSTPVVKKSDSKAPTDSLKVPLPVKPEAKPGLSPGGPGPKTSGLKPARGGHKKPHTPGYRHEPKNHHREGRDHEKNKRHHPHPRVRKHGDNDADDKRGRKPSLGGKKPKDGDDKPESTGKAGPSLAGKTAQKPSGDGKQGGKQSSATPSSPQA